MTNDVSRRNFVALAGATVTVAACDGSSISSSPERAGHSNKKFVPFTVVSEDSLSGLISSRRHQNPHIDRDDSIDIFLPQHIAIVHMIGNGNDFTSIHAHFELPGWGNVGTNTPDFRRDYAIRILEEKIANSYVLFSQNRNYQPKKRADGAFAEEENFHRFGFNSQHEIFIFIESTGINLMGHSLIVFKDRLQSGQISNSNESFFGAKRVNLSSVPRLNQGKMLRMRNYVSKLDHSQLASIIDQNPPSIYAFGIVYRPPSGNPTIFDPDTGNGYGNEP